LIVARPAVALKLRKWQESLPWQAIKGLIQSYLLSPRDRAAMFAACLPYFPLLEVTYVF
jgi:hypothetical protein